MRTRRNVMIPLRDECKQSTYTTCRPGAHQVGAENPGLQSLSSSLLTSSSSQTSSELSYGISLSEDSSELIFAKYMIALCKMNSKSMMMAERNLLRDAFVLHNFYAKYNLNDVGLHTNCPDWVSLFYFSQKNNAKMSNMSTHPQWSKFKGKNCEELKQ